MKEFDYNAARAGAPVCTRCGRPARIICWDANAKWDDDKFPIVALIDDDEDGEVAQTYTTDGRMYPNITHDDDLVMATTKREGWIILYNFKDDKRTSGSVYKTARDADMAAKEIVSGKDCWLVKIEWEE